MNQLLQILLKQSHEACYLDSSSFWWGLFKDVIIPIDIAAFAGYMVYWAFVKETRRDIANEQARKVQEGKDKLFYLSALVRSSLNVANKQKGYIEDYIKWIEEDDVNLKPIAKIVWEDLKRVSQILNLEEYMLAYANYYNSNRKEAVNEFKGIIGPIDLFYEQFNQIQERIMSAIKNNYGKKLQIQSAHEKSSLLIDKLNLHLFHTDQVRYNELKELMTPYGNRQEGDNYNFTRFNDLFFVPVSSFTNSYLTTSQIKFEEIFELNACTRRAIEDFATLKDESHNIKDSLISDLSITKEYIKKLETNSTNLLKDF